MADPIADLNAMVKHIRENAFKPYCKICIGVRMKWSKETGWLCPMIGVSHE